MKEKIETYIVSSADWELEIDDLSHREAARSALLFAFGKFGDKLLLSTVIMIRLKSDHKFDIIHNAEFYASSEILKDLGLLNLAEGFTEFTENIYELKNN